MVQSSREPQILRNASFTKFFTVIGSMLSKLRGWYVFLLNAHSDEFSLGFGNVLLCRGAAIRGARL